MNPPRVVMFSKPGGDRPFASQSFVYLSQIPYTGLAFNYKGFLFVLILSLWSAILSYLIIRKWNESLISDDLIKDSYDRSFDKNNRALSIGEVIKSKDDYVQKNYISKQASFNGDNLPTEKQDLISPPSIVSKIPLEEMKKLEEYAKNKEVLISIDAIESLCLSAILEDRPKIDFMNSVIEKSKTMYPRNDGFVILDKKRIEEILFSSKYSQVESGSYYQKMA